MNCETQTELEVFDVFISTSSVVNLKVRASTPEEARRLIAASFGLSDNFESDLTMRRMHCYRRLLAQNSPENTLETLEFDFTSEIHVEPKDNKVADEERHVTLVIREGDAYDTDMDDICEAIPCCGECRCCDELCMVYLLDQPAELIPVDSLKRYADELGKALETECIPDTALFLCYNPNSILDVDDARYLIAPALVYAMEDGEPAPMTDAEFVEAQQILSKRTVTLTADGEEFHALKLFD